MAENPPGGIPGCCFPVGKAVEGVPEGTDEGTAEGTPELELFTAATVLTLPDDAAALELFTVTELLLPLGKAPDPVDATDA